MQIIKPAFDVVQKVMGEQNFLESGDLCSAKQSVSVSCREGVLLYHVLTGELILLDHEEVQELKVNEALQTMLAKHWFLVPRGFDEVRMSNQVKTVIRLMKPQRKKITDYVIFTTTDCNARCFYCFEMGQKRIAMSEKTAKDAATYILNHCGGERVSIRWFGGEPLYNRRVIDIISEKLLNSGVKYASHMVTNGYLLDGAAIQKAQSLWHLKEVIITLDGTESVYNRTKAFIYQDENPFKKVMGNISLALQARIQVTVNLNMDARNAEDLLHLAEDLVSRFGNCHGFHARAGLLREYVGKIHSFSGEEAAWQALQRLNDVLKDNGILEKRYLGKGPALHGCMADSDSHISILPDGRLGKCEHFGDSGEIGNIYVKERNEPLVASWKESYPPEEKCKQCAWYPRCIRLIRCNGQSALCDTLYQRSRLAALEQAIIDTYKKVEGRDGRT